MATRGLAVAKKSEVRRHETTVRLDAEVVDKARRIASLRGESVAGYLSALLKPLMDREWNKTLASEMAKASRTPKGEPDPEK